MYVCLCVYIYMYVYLFYLAVVAIKISNLVICFRSFELSCAILQKDNFIENMYIILSCLNT